MKKIRFGVLGTSDIAFRRMIPAMKKIENIEFVGIAVATAEEYGKMGEEAYICRKEKAKIQSDVLGCRVFNSFTSIIESEDIDVIYIPLPPAYHFRWGMYSLQCGKHLFLEKPFTTSEKDTETLTKLADSKKLAICENYAFMYHPQIEYIKKKIASGSLGEIREIRTNFGFPLRTSSDFRYYADMGGGALLDCGGYPIKLASQLLGPSTEVVSSILNEVDGYEVDMFGTVLMKNKHNICAQISFGMDNAYQCQLEIWGSKKHLRAPRIFTAGVGVEALVELKNSVDELTTVYFESDQFQNFLNKFLTCITNLKDRQDMYHEINQQAKLQNSCR